MTSSGRHVCFICGKDRKLDRGICAECWEQARLRQKEEDRL